MWWEDEVQLQTKLIARAYQPYFTLTQNDRGGFCVARILSSFKRSMQSVTHVVCAWPGCSAFGTLRCGRCLSARYCSLDHQKVCKQIYSRRYAIAEIAIDPYRWLLCFIRHRKLDWKTHKKACKASAGASGEACGAAASGSVPSPSSALGSLFVGNAAPTPAVAAASIDSSGDPAIVGQGYPTEPLISVYRDDPQLLGFTTGGALLHQGLIGNLTHSLY